MPALLPSLWILTLFLAIAAWIYRRVSFSKAGGFRNRRQITGCEFVRQILDDHRFNRVAVKPMAVARTAHFHSRLGELHLPERIYYGTQLLDLAMGMHGAMHLLQESKALVPVELQIQGSRLFRMMVLASWFLIGGGMIFSRFESWVPIGQLLFIFTFLLALASLAEEWEVTSRSLASLSKLEEFEPNERMHLKRLLRAIQWTPLAELFGSPFTLFARTTEKVKGHAVSKFS